MKLYIKARSSRSEPGVSDVTEDKRIAPIKCLGGIKGCPSKKVT